MTDVKNAEHYLNLPYTVVLRRDEEGDFVARVDELPGCAAHGKTEQEALEHLREAKDLWITACLEEGQLVPEPSKEEELPSGKWVQRVPRSLHKKLAELAKQENVSLNQLATSILSEAVGLRKSIQERQSQTQSYTAVVNWGAHDEILRAAKAGGFWNIVQIPSREISSGKAIDIIRSRLPNRIETRKTAYDLKEAKHHEHRTR